MKKQNEDIGRPNNDSGGQNIKRMTNKETLQKLYHEHHERMYLLARFILHDDEESKDAVSDVFAQLSEGPLTVAPETAGSFLLTCTRNRCLKLLRGRKVKERFRKLQPLDDATAGMATPDDPTDRLQQLSEYARTALTEQTYRVFRLRFHDHLKYSEIATALHISEAAVYKHIAQALTKLKQRFNP